MSEAQEANKAESGEAVAYRAIRKRILEGHYSPGVAISMADLEAELNLSRTPIRYALIKLQEENLIELVPRHGFRVLPISPWEMQEIYEVLAGLELAAIELLIERGPTHDELAQLRNATRKMEDALSRNELEEWADADLEFHQLLLALPKNSRLRKTAEQFYDQTSRVRMLTLRLRPLPIQSTGSHGDLVDAIRRRDAASARELHWNQRLRSGRELTEILAKLNIRQL